MVDIQGNNADGVDLSIIPSLQCNLECSFCMYAASPNRTEILDRDKTYSFLKTIPWIGINSIGFYGGEPSINLPLYEQFLWMIPKDVKRFIITNGSWSTNLREIENFIAFTRLHSLEVYISGTPEHLVHQNLAVIKQLLIQNNYHLKEDDTTKKLLPMGRNQEGTWKCSGMCAYKEKMKPTRLAILPDGNIIYQLCDGVYPVVGSIDNPFDLKNYLENCVSCLRSKPKGDTLNSRMIATMGWMIEDMTTKADITRGNIEIGSQGGYSPELIEAKNLLAELKGEV